jgi:hypothetical protein
MKNSFIQRRTLKALALTLIVIVQFVIWGGIFGRALGFRPRGSWQLEENEEPVQLSEDGRILVTMSDLITIKETDEWLREIRVWDVATGKKKWVISTPYVFRLHCKLSSDGHYLAHTRPAGEGAANIRIYDVSEGKSIATFEACRFTPSIMGSPFGDPYPVRYGFSPFGDVLATSGPHGGEENILQLWSIATGSRIARIGPISDWMGFQFSADNKAIAYKNDKNQVVVWDIPRNRIRHTLDPSPDAPSAGFQAISPDGNSLTRRILLPDKNVYGYRTELWDLWEQKVLRSEHREVFSYSKKQQLTRVFHANRHMLYSVKSADNRTVLEELFTARRVAAPPALFDERYSWEVRGKPGSEVCTRPVQIEEEKSAMHLWFESFFRPQYVRAKFMLECYDGSSGDYIGAIPCERETTYAQTGVNVGILDSPNASALATLDGEQRIAVWGVPPRRPISLILLLAGLHTALITALAWWYWGRGR